MRVTESGAIVARLLVPRLALDRRPDCRGALVPMGLAPGPPDARRDIGEPVARRPAHHRRIGVDKLAGAKFPQSGVGLIVCLPRHLATLSRLSKSRASAMRNRRWSKKPCTVGSTIWP